MEEITKMLQKIRDDMKQQKEDITKSINDNINEKFQSLDIRSAAIEQKLEKQDQLIHNFDKILRRRNIVFFGVEEVEKSYHDLETNILTIINKNMNISCEVNNIEFIRRLGRRDSEKVRPVAVTFTTMGKKIHILKKKNSLNLSPYYIKEDFPPEVLNKRKELQKQITEERKQGKNAILNYDKIIYLKDKLSTTSNNAKRTIISPETSIKPQPAKKKNKIDLKKYVSRKPRITPNQSENASESE